jgi:hypothetical protein
MSEVAKLDIAQGRDPAPLRPTPARAGLDQQWITPVCLCSCLVERVLPTLDSTSPIWEGAAGNGAIVDAVRATGREVIATDIAPRRADIGQLDFLKDPPPTEAIGGILATNPPFARSGLGDLFLARAMALLEAGDLSAVVFLQRGDASSTDGRAELFNRSAAEYRCNWRARWIQGTTQGPRWWFAWHVWRSDHVGPPATFRIRRRELVTADPRRVMRRV